MFMYCSLPAGQAGPPAGRAGKGGKINIKEENIKRNSDRNRKGKLFIVGIGPGDVKHVTQRALDAIKESQIIIGYKTYIELLGKLTKNKKVFPFQMMQERRRALSAINFASHGEKVCVISSGDPGVYGMASIILEILKNDEKKNIDIEIIPGIIAATACAALLGAPLSHDFCAISLSDLLTPKKEIINKLKLAAKADFVIVLYNPKSKKRIILLKKAWEIISKFRKPDTPVGIVRNAYRDEQSVKIVKLKEAPFIENIDMSTTIIIGNSRTYIKNGYIITPRGYDISSKVNSKNFKWHKNIK